MYIRVTGQTTHKHIYIWFDIIALTFGLKSIDIQTYLFMSTCTVPVTECKLGRFTCTTAFKYKSF